MENTIENTGVRFINPMVDYFRFQDKREPKNWLGFNVHWVFENEIYAEYLAGLNWHPMRVLAILTSSADIKNEILESYVFGYQGDKSGQAGPCHITKQYRIINYPKKTLPETYVNTGSRQDLARVVKFPPTGTEHNNHHIYWAHDVSNSEVFARESNKKSSGIYRVTQILMPNHILYKNNTWPVSYPIENYCFAYPIDYPDKLQLIKANLYDEGFNHIP